MAPNTMGHPDDPRIAVNVRDAAVQHSGTEFLDARHAAQKFADHAGHPQQAGRVIEVDKLPEPGRVYTEAGRLRGFAEIEAGRPRLEGDTPVKRPFGTGGMIDRVSTTLSEVERLFDMLGGALEPTLERERTEPSTGACPREAVAIPDTPHGESLHDIDGRLKTLAYRINRLGSRVRL